MTPPLIGQVKGLVKVLNLLAGKQDEAPEAEKVDGGQLAKATKALEKLTALVKRLKEQDAGAEEDQ